MASSRAFQKCIFYIFEDVSFVKFGRQTWDLEGRGSHCPPPANPGFQVPQQGKG